MSSSLAWTVTSQSAWPRRLLQLHSASASWFCAAGLRFTSSEKLLYRWLAALCKWCAPEIKNPIILSFYAIAAGSSVVIAVLLATRTVTSEIVVLVPVGSMIIANAMNACAQAMERFRADITAHVGLIETGLALGADPAATVAPYVQSAVYASLLPRLDMLKSLGFVWIPGVMAGMLVSGASPVYAGIFQFIVVAMILAASGIAGLVATLLMRARAFSSAAQLTLRATEPT